jgi:predicted RNase H-like HicB family nuclease
MHKYVGLLRRQSDGFYTVAFPDLPGCVAKAASRDDAFSCAQEAVATHLEDLRAQGEPIPRPVAPHVITDDKANADAGIITITVPTPAEPDNLICEAIELIARSYPASGTALQKTQWMAKLQADLEARKTEEGDPSAFPSQ